MKHYALLTLLITLFCSFTNISYAGRTATCTIKNFQRAGDTYSFDVFARRTGAPAIRVNSIDFYFNYNNYALINPVLTNVNVKYSTGNYVMLVVVTEENDLRFKVRYTGDGRDTRQKLSSAAPSGELLCTVNLTITNPSENANLNWNINESQIVDEHGDITHTFIGHDESPLPIQLSSFTGLYLGDSVQLKWTTLSETSNFGFFIQRKISGVAEYDLIGFVPGHNTTVEPHNYTFADSTISSNLTYQYRLNQIDLNGESHPTEAIEVSTTTLDVTNNEINLKFKLNQNYPNPFNPSTNISFSLTEYGYVSLKIYNVLGQEVITLIDGVRETGNHTEVWNASNMTTGTYFAKLISNKSVSIIKMNLIK